MQFVHVVVSFSSVLSGVAEKSNLIRQGQVTEIAGRRHREALSRLSLPSWIVDPGYLVDPSAKTSPVRCSHQPSFDTSQV